MPRSQDYEEPTDATSPVDGPAPRGEVDLMPNEARQGVTHHNVRTVLAVGLLGAVVLLGFAWLYFFA
jgi:hypothetical protein